jgi:hypothetical protein
MSATNGTYSSYGSYSAGTPGSDAYGSSTSYGAGAYGSTRDNDDSGPSLRRRTVDPSYGTNGSDNDKKKNAAAANRNVVKSLDFMFPKVEQEFTIQTDRGGLAFVVALGLISLLCLAETISWVGANRATTDHVAVDTSLGHRMRVNLNLTFPALACEDLHVDIMDVAGDSQLNIDNTLTKTRLRPDGRVTGRKEKVDSNLHQKQQQEADKVLKAELPDKYCGPCYGAQASDDACCNTCDEVLEAYKQKRWKTDVILTTSEQCIREGRHKSEPKRMTKGEGCNLVGYMTINRVAGNFHIAMGEGVERGGRHIHTFQPDDTQNFNASHIIHHMSFGTPDATNGHLGKEAMPLNGVQKIVGSRHGTTGLFQYFIKVVPTTYVTAEGRQESNGYFFTERFRPLMEEYLTDKHMEDGPHATVNAGTAGSHHDHEHHDVKKNAILPGVFFIYEIYPFAVEITENSVPLTHLLIRLMATVGGVFTLMKMADSLLFESR